VSVFCGSNEIEMSGLVPKLEIRGKKKSDIQKKYNNSLKLDDKTIFKETVKPKIKKVSGNKYKKYFKMVSDNIFKTSKYVTLPNEKFDFFVTPPFSFLNKNDVFYYENYIENNKNQKIESEAVKPVNKNSQSLLTKKKSHKSDFLLVSVMIVFGVTILTFAIFIIIKNIAYNDNLKNFNVKQQQDANLYYRNFFRSKENTNATEELDKQLKLEKLRKLSKEL
jgi:hypothetical protein